ncbi:hypothetical protein OG871_02155 [Kitasatospora sp. NBC_00374]|uniref:hypothetical protein n=1 Tax=Kitasatospora sp. NBC_00374 TaxID=2975964 RepID=UPI0032511012
MPQSQPQPSPQPDPEPLCTSGAWVFVPDSTNSLGEVQHGYLTCDGERVVLPYCSGVLADLLRTIRQLEGDIAHRWDSLPTPAGA